VTRLPPSPSERTDLRALLEADWRNTRSQRRYGARDPARSRAVFGGECEGGDVVCAALAVAVVARRARRRRGEVTIVDSDEAPENLTPDPNGPTVQVRPREVG